MVVVTEIVEPPSTAGIGDLLIIADYGMASGESFIGQHDKLSVAELQMVG